MLVNQKDIITVENGKVISKHSYRPVLRLSFSKEREEAICDKELLTTEELQACLMATD